MRQTHPFDNTEETAAYAAAREAEIAKIAAMQDRAAGIAASLDNRRLAAQVLICGVDSRGTLSQAMRTLLTECPAGAIMFFRFNLNTSNDEIQNFLAEIADLVINESGIPPFMAVDHEGGEVNRFRPGVATLPSAFSYWELAEAEGWEAALERVKKDSFEAGRQINALGFNMNFAPVAEFLNEENSAFLRTRSYGPDPVFTANAASAFARGMEGAGVLPVVKHFPGNAGIDPHYHISVMYGDREVLDEQVTPFVQLVNEGARAIMVAHSLVPAVDSEIASLSSVVMNDWLRRDLGFTGIIVSDCFAMTAANPSGGHFTIEEAAISSLAAGADMVMVWPRDIRRTHRAIIAALENERLCRERLQEAASRVIFEKIRMGMISEDR